MGRLQYSFESKWAQTGDQFKSTSAMFEIFENLFVAIVTFAFLELLLIFVLNKKLRMKAKAALYLVVYNTLFCMAFTLIWNAVDSAFYDDRSTSEKAIIRIVANFVAGKIVLEFCEYKSDLASVVCSSHSNYNNNFTNTSGSLSPPISSHLPSPNPRLANEQGPRFTVWSE